MIPFGKTKPRFLQNDAVNTSDGYPVNAKGTKLPFIDKNNTLQIDTRSEIFAFWKASENPNIFGLRDILRYVQASDEVWDAYSIEPKDSPECKQCPYAVLAQDSQTGAQIQCSKKIRSGRFPACEPICHIRKISLTGGTHE